MSGAEEVIERARAEAGTIDPNRVPELHGWLGLVETGGIPACQEQHALCRHVREAMASERLWLDSEALRRYMGYQRLFPWELGVEERFLVCLWLCVYRADGMPRWPDLLVYAGRGFGKTGFGAFLSLCLISPANGVPNYDVDVCATTSEQSRLCFEELRGTFERDPDLFRQGFSWNKQELTCRETGSRMKYWSGNSGSKDGMRSGAVLFDEIHAYPDERSMAVFTGGLGKKPFPRRLFMTTDGDVRDGVLDEKKAQARAILTGGEPDMGFLPFVCKLDSRDEIPDEAAWPKANPRLLNNAFLLERYRADVADWRRDPDRHPEVPTKRFNLPTERRSVAVADWDDLVAASADPGDLSGRACVCGIDLAKTTDMVGAALLFRDGERWQAIVHGWWCTASADRDRVRAPLEEWAALGVLTVVDAQEIDPSLVADWLAGAMLRYDVRAVCLDSYRAALLRRDLAAIGWDVGDRDRVKLARPSDEMRAQPLVDAALRARRVSWGDNPLVRWAAGNACLVPAPHGNWCYGKQEPHGRKTDPFMALVHAFEVAEQIPEDVGTDVPEPFFF